MVDVFEGWMVASNLHHKQKVTIFFPTFLSLVGGFFPTRFEKYDRQIGPSL